MPQVCPLWHALLWRLSDAQVIARPDGTESSTEKLLWLIARPDGTESSTGS